MAINYALAHRRNVGGYGGPVILENPAAYPFAEGERDRDWRLATSEEWDAYVAYWMRDDYVG